MRVLFIPYGTEKAPATRYRVMQYLPRLKERGIEHSVFSAISRLSTFLMVKSPDFGSFARFAYYLYVFIERLFRAFYIILISRKFDIVFLQRTTFPFKLERLLEAFNKNIVFDIDDAVYLPDREGSDVITRMKKYVKKEEVAGILNVSKAVIVENDYIRDFVSGYCRNILKIPGPIDTERFFVRQKQRSNEIVIGWIGSPATTSYLYGLDGALGKIGERYDFAKFNFIGLGKYKNPDIKFERIDWSYETEVEELQNFDIGIMPMPDNEWTRGKLGCKMLQYMAVGIPAVVSYTPTNAEIIRNGENGFFASSVDEWIEVLSRLIEDGELRRKVGEEGRKTIVQKCSLEANAERLSDIFRKNIE